MRKMFWVYTLYHQLEFAIQHLSKPSEHKKTLVDSITYLRGSLVQAIFFVHIWRREAENLAWTQRSSNQIRFLSFSLNDFMFRTEISTCAFSMICGLHMFKADWQWKGNNTGRLITWQHRGYLEVLVGNSGIWEATNQEACSIYCCRIWSQILRL